MKDKNARGLTVTILTVVVAAEEARSGHTFADWQMWAVIALACFVGISYLAVMDWMDGEK